MTDAKKIIIVGGGFGGLHLARKLSKTNYDVLLIDKLNYHQFQPLFYQVATARLEPSNISFPFRKLFQSSPNITIRLAELTGIISQENKITTSEGDFKYDHLVLATGCKTNFFGNESMARHAFSMKTTEEAIQIRNEILLGFEKCISAHRPEEKEAYLNIVIVGGGPTGVEMAGAFAEMKKYILPKDYPNEDFSRLRITLIEGSKHTLNSMSDTAKQASRKYLENLGVFIKTENVVTDYDGNKLTLKSGEVIPTHNVIWAAGVTGNIMPGLLETSVSRNRYLVDRYSKINGYENIYALGDIACMITPKYPSGHPQLANVAINQAKNLGVNFLRNLRDNKRVEYEYKDLGSMATIGKHKAVVDLPRFSFHGRLAWLTWMFLHLMLILSVRNKIMIFINWAWHYFTKDTSLRLIFRRRS